MTAPASGIYGCERAGGIRRLTRGDLPPALRAEIRSLQRVEPWRNVRRLAAFLALWVVAGVALLSTDWLPVEIVSTLAAALALVGLSVLMHEGAHHMLLPSRASNRVMGLCCGLPVLIPVSAYRAMHLRHHAFERTADDPDDIERVVRRGLPLVLVYYVLLLLGTYLYFPHVLVEAMRASRGLRARAVILAEYGLLVGGLVSAWRLAPDPMMHVWLLPILVAAQITNLRSIAEHGLTTAGSPFTASRTVLSNAFARFFFCNLNFHLEHHLFPAVPWYNLPSLHQLLLPAYRETGASVYRSYTAFLRDFVVTARRGLVPDVRLLPAHLREDVCG